MSYNNRFDKIDGQFVHMNKQMDKLTVAVVKGFDRIDKALETKADKSDVQKIYKILDKISKQQEIADDERLVMGHQLDRLDHWVHEVANKIDYKLSA